MSAFDPCEVGYQNHCSAQQAAKVGLASQGAVHEALVLISVKIASGFYAMLQCCLGAVMTTVRHILEDKGRQVWSVRPGDKVYDAIKMMADKDVGRSSCWTAAK